MSVLVKIKAQYLAFTSKEKQIADFISSSPQAIKDLSSKELGAAIGVSQSSIVKFTQKLGYKGYPALKLALVESINKQSKDQPLPGDISLEDNIEQLADKLLASKVNVLKETFQINDAASFEQATDLILHAKRILVSGIGASGLVAKDFGFKLQKVGLPAISEASGHSQLAYSATFGRGDLVIAISESGRTADVIAVAEQATSRGAKVISITGVTKNKLQKLAQIPLYSVAEKSSLRLSSILARTSQELIIDTLFIALTQKSDEFRERVQVSNEAVSDYVENGNKK